MLVLWIGVSVLIICITQWIYYRKSPRYSEKLPPGSMGLPLLGETLSFFKTNTTYDVTPFIRERIDRYGPIFKTSIVGRHIIASADSEFNHFVFTQEGKLFQSWYPKSFKEILGSQNMGDLHGFLHKHLKNMVLNLFGPESLKTMLPEVQRAGSQRLQRWSVKKSVELHEEIASMVLDLTAKKLISCEEDDVSRYLRDNFADFIDGLISIPLNFPGFSYYKCLQGRKNIMNMLKKLLDKRRATPRKNRIDFFDYVLEELEKEGTILTETIALDLMFLLLFASFETTSLALTFAMKMLSEHPSVLKKLTEEHEAILQNKENNSELTWKDYKSMTYTFQFMNETVRLANIAPVLFRKILTDIQYKGYTIPAGWSVMVSPPGVHVNPATYPDPLTFNPSRWEGTEIHGASKTFMAFGGGMRFCIGADFAKVQMATFLHCLVTKYKWETIKGGNIIRTPGLQFPDGFHVRLMEKTTTG